MCNLCSKIIVRGSSEREIGLLKYCKRCKKITLHKINCREHSDETMTLGDMALSGLSLGLLSSKEVIYECKKCGKVRR